MKLISKFAESGNFCILLTYFEHAISCDASFYNCMFLNEKVKFFNVKPFGFLLKSLFFHICEFWQLKVAKT